MREYAVIDSAASVEQLRMRLKDGELEQYGEPFIPEYVYEAIKQLPRFSSMRVRLLCLSGRHPCRTTADVNHSEGNSRMQRSSWASC